MGKDDLEDLLSNLRAEIAALPAAEAASRERLEALVASLEDELEDNDEVLSGLRETIERLEGEHPRTMALVNRIATLLSGAGL